MKNLAIPVCAALVATWGVFACRADEAPAAGAPAASEESQPEPKKKKPPRKDAEYRDWAKASAVAEAWEQPIVAYVEVSGDKQNMPVKSKTVGNPLFKKEFVPKNAIFFVATVPAVKQKTVNNNNGQKREKPPVKPDFESMNKNVRAAVQRLGADQRAQFPLIVLADPTGRALDSSLGGYPPDTFAAWIESLKRAMETANYKVEISSKLQGEMEKEKKKFEKEKARKAR